MSPNAHLVARTVETSEPSEIDEAFLKDELGLGKEGSAMTGLEAAVAGTKLGGAANAFAKPRGPARKR